MNRNKNRFGAYSVTYGVAKQIYPRPIAFWLSLTMTWFIIKVMETVKNENK